MEAGLQYIASLLVILSCRVGSVYTACADIDAQACHLMASSRPDLCTDPTLSTSACPRYCKLCPVECYHCDASVTDFHMCNTPKTCAKGEVCMKKQLQSSDDGHVEYQLTCATKQACDGLGLVIPFGKRGVMSRDVSVSCCDSDRCNYPYEEQTTTTPVPTTTTTTSIPACKKDVLIIVDETSSLSHYVNDITGFLEGVVRQLNIGNDNVLVSLATFDTYATKQWGFGTHTDSSSLLNEISTLQLKGSTDGDLNAAISYALSEVNSGKHGNRADAPDIVMIITDDAAKTAFLETIYENKLHTSSDSVIAIGIGRGVTDTEIEHLASDSQHDFKIPRPQYLDRLTNQVVPLVCGY